jgi:hypothetical protein
MNADGERELLHRASDLGVQRMVSLKRKAETKLIPDTVDYKKDTGTYYVHDVYKGIGMKGIPRGEAKKLRVVEIDYRAAPVGAKFNSGEGGGSLNSTPMSIGNATWDVKRILGDADIHEDGSVLVEVPAMVSQYHQILNAKGQVIQTTRTWDTLRPGERKSCIGCHDKTNANFHPYKEEDTMAWKHGVQPLQPFYGKTRGFSFVKEIQPILDRSCVDCHDVSNKERTDLRGIPTDGKSLNKRQWTTSYLNLTGAKADKRNSFVTQHPEKGIVSWISQMSRPTELPPYFAGSAKSPLMKMLEDGHQGAKLTEEDMHKLYAWIDLLVPFSGDYREGHAWGKGEMQFYDYYENKRKAQHAEERQNIVYLLAASGAHPQDNKSSAAFTRASYRSVLKNIELSPNAQGRHELERYPAAIIETLSLSSDAKNPMSVTLRDRKTNRVLHELRIEPGTSASTRFSENINTGNTYLECSDKQATITIFNAVGVLFEELPGDDSYRRHSFAK